MLHIKHENLPGSVASNDTRPGNELGLFLQLPRTRRDVTLQPWSVLVYWMKGTVKINMTSCSVVVTLSVRLPEDSLMNQLIRGLKILKLAF